MCNLILTTWYYKSFCMLVWTWKYSMKKLQHTFDIEILISHILFFKLDSLLESSSKEFYDWSSNVKNQKIHDTKAFFWLNLHAVELRSPVKNQNSIQLQESYCRMQKPTSKQIELKCSSTILTDANKSMLYFFGEFNPPWVGAAGVLGAGITLCSSFFLSCSTIPFNAVSNPVYILSLSSLACFNILWPSSSWSTVCTKSWQVACTKIFK